MSVVALLSIAALVGAWWLTGRVRRYAIDRVMLDVPNERSSHETPTPRGGGVAIVATTLLAVAAGTLLGLVPVKLAAALAGGGLMVAVVGFLDDHGGVSTKVRLGIHLAAACWAVSLTLESPELRVGEHVLALGIPGYVLAVLFVTWILNLYNFMDGIDGLAAAQAVVAAGAGGTIMLVAGNSGIALPALVLAAASLGFLKRNWTPAEIFMGDVGSGFIGYYFATLALVSEASGGLPLFGWIILLGVFVSDATLTLFRRGIRGEAVYQAHRSHAYQRLAASGWSHPRVTSWTVALMLILAVLATAGWLIPYLMPLCLLLSASILVAGYLAVERRKPMARRQP